MRNPLAQRSVLDLAPRSKALAYAMMIFWSLVVLFPLYWLVICSLKTPLQVNSGPFYIPFVDFLPTGANWHYILVEQGSDVIRPYINTVIVSLSSAVLALLLGSTAAYGIVRFRYRPRVGMIVLGVGSLVFALVVTAFAGAAIGVVCALAVFLILLPAARRRGDRRLGNADIAFWLIAQRMMPPVAVVIPVYVMFQRIGLLDTLPALIVTYVATNLPIVVWLMRDYFLAIPMELEEAADVDGASPWQIFRRIVVPVSVPGLLATFILILVFSWNEYLIALFLSTANAQTMPILVAAQNATRGPQYWYMSVLIVVMVIPVIVMAMILERYIARGILTGAVKG